MSTSNSSSVASTQNKGTRDALRSSIEDRLAAISGEPNDRKFKGDMLLKALAIKVFQMEALLKQGQDGLHEKLDVISGNQQLMIKDSAQMIGKVSESVKEVLPEAIKQAIPKQERVLASVENDEMGDDVLGGFALIGGGGAQANVIEEQVNPIIDEQIWEARLADFENEIAPDAIVKKYTKMFEDHLVKIKDVRAELRFVRHTLQALLNIEEVTFEFLTMTDKEILEALPSISDEAVKQCCLFTSLQAEHLRSLHPTFFTWIGQLNDQTLEVLRKLDDNTLDAIRNGNVPDVLNHRVQAVCPSGTDADRKSIEHSVKGSLDKDELGENDFLHLKHMLQIDQDLLAHLQKMTAHTLSFVNKMAHVGHEIALIDTSDVMALRGRFPPSLIHMIACLPPDASRALGKLSWDTINIITGDKEEAIAHLVDDAKEAKIQEAQDEIMDKAYGFISDKCENRDERLLACKTDCLAFFEKLDDHLVLDLKSLIEEHSTAFVRFCNMVDRVGVAQVIFREDLLSKFGKSTTFPTSLWIGLKPDKSYGYNDKRGDHTLFKQRLTAMHNACVQCDCFDERMNGFKIYFDEEQKRLTDALRPLLSEGEAIKELCEKEIDRVKPLVKRLTIPTELTKKQLKYLATIEGGRDWRKRYDALLSEQRKGNAHCKEGQSYMDALNKLNVDMHDKIHEDDEVLFNYSYLCYCIEGSRSLLAYLHIYNDDTALHVPWKRTFRAWYYNDKDGGKYTAKFNCGNPSPKNAAERGDDGKLPPEIEESLKLANQVLAGQLNINAGDDDVVQLEEDDNSFGVANDIQSAAVNKDNRGDDNDDDVFDK